MESKEDKEKRLIDAEIEQQERTVKKQDIQHWKAYQKQADANEHQHLQQQATLLKRKQQQERQKQLKLKESIQFKKTQILQEQKQDLKTQQEMEQLLLQQKEQKKQGFERLAQRDKQHLQHLSLLNKTALEKQQQQQARLEIQRKSVGVIGKSDKNRLYALTKVVKNRLRLQDTTVIDSHIRNQFNTLSVHSIQPRMQPEWRRAI